MTNRHYGQSTWLDCTVPGCDAGTHADLRHVPNVTAAGGWTCHLHDNEEVPC